MKQDNWKQYRVSWTLPGSPSTPYYRGKKDVWAEDGEDAGQRAIQQVYRDFRHLSISSFRIDRVEEL